MVAYDDPPAAKAAIEWFNGMRLFRGVTSVKTDYHFNKDNLGQLCIMICVCCCAAMCIERSWCL